MDTAAHISAREAARRLGTTVPRVKRAIDRSGIRATKGPAGRVRLNHQQFERLRRQLGSDIEVPGLSRTEARVLAALSRAPRGLRSVRAVAARAGVSPTAAGRAVSELERRKLLTRERAWIAAGRAEQVELLTANVTSPAWSELAPRLARIEPPRRGRVLRHERVSAYLRHLFWNTASSQLEVGRAGGYIARRLVQTGDLDGLAWGADNLPAEAWREAATARGLQPAQRALATNLAQDAE